MKQKEKTNENIISSEMIVMWKCKGTIWTSKDQQVKTN